MGIYKLMDFIKKKAPSAYRHLGPNDLKNRTLAIDASNTIYQFLIKTQTFSSHSTITMPTDWQGNKTGHIIGILYRVLMCFQFGVNPIWVFDGRPPKQKFEELRRRKKLKNEAQQKLNAVIQEAASSEDLQIFKEDMLKYSQRTVRISSKETEDAKKVINLMGMKVITAPSEAEPQCAQLYKQGIVDGVVSQDMDTLAFGAGHLIRGFSRNNIVSSFVPGDTANLTIQIDLQKFLSQAQLTYHQFVDFCILCGCDYSSRIQNLGPVNAYKFIKTYGNIENMLEHIVNNEKLRSRFRISDQFNFLRARDLFTMPQVKGKEQIISQAGLQGGSNAFFEIGNIKEEQLRDFLLERQFSRIRVQNWLTKAKTFKQKWLQKTSL